MPRLRNRRVAVQGYCHTPYIRSLWEPYAEPCERGGIRHFEGMPASVLSELMANLPPALLEQTQNDSPSMREFVEFGRRYDDVTFHGYVVEARREDERVSVEGFSAPLSLYDEMERQDLVRMSKADQFGNYRGRLFAWWD